MYPLCPTKKTKSVECKEDSRVDFVVGFTDNVN